MDFFTEYPRRHIDRLTSAKSYLGLVEANGRRGDRANGYAWRALRRSRGGHDDLGDGLRSARPHFAEPLRVVLHRAIDLDSDDQLIALPHGRAIAGVELIE